MALFCIPKRKEPREGADKKPFELRFDGTKFNERVFLIIINTMKLSICFSLISFCISLPLHNSNAQNIRIQGLETTLDNEPLYDGPIGGGEKN